MDKKIILIGILALASIFYTNNVSATWFNNSYGACRNIAVNNTFNSVSLTNYQEDINLTFATNTSNYADVIFSNDTCNGNSNAISLPHFQNSYLASTWDYETVKIDTLGTATNRTISVYYGNTTPVTTTGNSTTTFQMYESADCSIGLCNNWTSNAPSSIAPTSVAGFVINGTHSMNTTWVAGGTQGAYYNFPNSTKYIASIYMNQSSSNNVWEQLIIGDSGTNGYYSVGIHASKSDGSCNGNYCDAAYYNATDNIGNTNPTFWNITPNGTNFNIVKIDMLINQSSGYTQLARINNGAWNMITAYDSRTSPSVNYGLVEIVPNGYVSIYSDNLIIRQYSDVIPNYYVNTTPYGSSSSSSPQYYTPLISYPTTYDGATHTLFNITWVNVTDQMSTTGNNVTIYNIAGSPVLHSMNVISQNATATIYGYDDGIEAIGNYEYWFLGNTTANLQNQTGSISSGYYVYSINSTSGLSAPYYYVPSVNNPTTYSNSQHTFFNVSWENTTNQTSVSLLETNSLGSLANYTMNLISQNTSFSNYGYDIGVLNAGTYTYEFLANSSVPIWNSTNTNSFTIAVNGSSFYLPLTLSPNYIVTVGTQTTATGICAYNFTCSMYKDGSLVNNPDVETLGIGAYTYIFNSTGNATYGASTNSIILYVTPSLPNEPANPTIFLNLTTLFEPNSSYYVSGVIPINWTVTDSANDLINYNMTTIEIFQNGSSLVLNTQQITSTIGGFPITISLNTTAHPEALRYDIYVSLLRSGFPLYYTTYSFYPSVYNASGIFPNVFGAFSHNVIPSILASFASGGSGITNPADIDLIAIIFAVVVGAFVAKTAGAVVPVSIGGTAGFLLTLGIFATVRLFPWAFLLLLAVIAAGLDLAVRIL